MTTKLIAHGRYLGNNAVVDQLSMQFMVDALSAKDANGLMAVINRFADIFQGMDDNYLPVGGWNDSQHLGRELAKRLRVSYEQSGSDVFRTAFMVLAQHVLQLVKDCHGQDDSVIQEKTLALRRYMTAVLMGTASNLYPDGWQ